MRGWKRSAVYHCGLRNAESSAVPLSAESASATATPSADPNLLSWRNGTIVRRYPAEVDDTTVNTIAEIGLRAPASPAPPYVFVYELAGPAAITAFTAELPVPEASEAPTAVSFATSISGASGDFKDAGTISATSTPGVARLSASVTARWIRVTASAPFTSIGAEGSIQPSPTSASPAGIYVEMNVSPYKGGTFDATAIPNDPWYQRIVVQGNAATGTRCTTGYGNPYPGSFDGRFWTWVSGGSRGRAAINDDGSMIVGADTADSPIYLMRSTVKPPYCVARSSGSGPHHVLVLDSQNDAGFWPVDQNSLSGYAYDRISAGMVNADALNGHELAILNMVCTPSDYMAPQQTAALVQWVAAGHKLAILGSDGCSPKTDYSFLPYAFVTSNPGAKGASGDRLIVVENDALGTTDKNDSQHLFDPKIFINDGHNELGDANIVTTQDPHWCGHLFGTNALHDNGFMQMYAPYGQGLIIYDGFDHDDSGNAGYQRMRQLEFALPVPVSMPCTQSAALSFLIEPNQEATFASGTASTLHVPMETLANLGWAGHVTVATKGDFSAAVTPGAFDMNGGTQPLAITVNVPASAKPGAYTVNVVGTGSDGKTAQAAIVISGTAAIKKAVLKKHERIRIYGIHFDVDSAHIQPRSEPVIAQIADLMRANPSWRFEISGHTDSDGGAAYNRALSQRRAQAVVDDLVTRYGVARSRMVPKGYGLTRPIASNATDAGKALNRRVELERLQ